jgi:DNA topoisomerase-3
MGVPAQEGEEGNLVAVASRAKGCMTEDVLIVSAADHTTHPRVTPRRPLLIRHGGCGQDHLMTRNCALPWPGRGLGTPATRAQIIENLMGEQYLHA